MNTDRELQFGPGMRVQRLVEAGFIISALFTQDVRFVYVTFVLTVLQVLSPRWVPVAIVVARLAPFRGEHTRSVLVERCGYTDARVDELAATGVFGDVEV